MRLAASGELVAGCEVRPLDKTTANLSYWTYPRFRQRGFGTRAARLAVAVAFDELGLRRIEVVIDVDNAASRAIAGNLGALPAGMRDGQLLFVLTASD